MAVPAVQVRNTKSFLENNLVVLDRLPRTCPELSSQPLLSGHIFQIAAGMAAVLKYSCRQLLMFFCPNKNGGDTNIAATKQIEKASLEIYFSKDRLPEDLSFDFWIYC